VPAHAAGSLLLGARTGDRRAKGKNDKTRRVARAGFVRG